MTTQPGKSRPEHRPAFRQPLRFDPPTSIEAAEARKLELQASIGEIEAQLADKNRRNMDTGERMTAEQYHDWRRRAISSLTLKSAELRMIKAWLKARNQPNRARVILADLVFALGNVHLEGVEPHLQELAGVLERAREELGIEWV